MRRFVLILAATAAALLSGCRENPGIRDFWTSRTLNVDDYAAAEAEFTDFVEQAVAAPEADACAAIDVLLEKASQDDVTYIIYAEWILRGFSAIASPCHNCALFLHAADWIRSHGIPSADVSDRYEARRAFCLHNRVGDPGEVPGVLPGAGAAVRAADAAFAVAPNADATGADAAVRAADAAVAVAPNADATGAGTPAAVTPAAVTPAAVTPAAAGESLLVAGRRTLVLVVDQDCTSCRASLELLSRQEADRETALVALCIGRGPFPEEPGWTYARLDPEQRVLDPREAPYYYIVSAEGTVEQTYTPVHGGH